MADLPTIEGFRLVEELGSGALSTVYKAIEEPLGRIVALKVLKNTIATDSPFAAQLEREARVLAGLSHPNVGLLYAFVKRESRMHLVLEFVDGASLATLMKRRPIFPPDAVAILGAAVARGLAHAHDRGIVHRDVKPANILVSRRGEVKVFDFGIAQRTAAAGDANDVPPLRLEKVAAFGTPAYMAPEQILGEAVDARSDIFSLGVVLYQMLCGARPFEREDAAADQRPAANRIRWDPPIRLHRRAPNVPVALERVVMRAIQKLPADRFSGAEAMAQSLDEIVAARSNSLGSSELARLLERVLEDAGLSGVAESNGIAIPVRRGRASARRAIGGLAALGAAAVIGGTVVQTTANRDGESAGAHPLDLLPPKPGYLRVLATPWAEVWIDGQRVEVTPFARPIPLSEGTHYVTLTHPGAPPENRTITIVHGEVRAIDVVMNVSVGQSNDHSETADGGGQQEASADETALHGRDKR